MKKYQPTIKNICGLACFILAILLGSCTDNYMDYNSNPNGVTEEQMEYDNLKTGAFVVQMQTRAIPLDANQYQRAINLTGDVYSGYFGASNNWYSNSNNTTYALINEWCSEPFSVAYEGVMPAWRLLKLNSQTENPPVYALAQILKVFALHRTTDTYGPLPYFKFGEVKEAAPYDAQDAIYYSFFDDLDAAIKVLDEYVTVNPTVRPLKVYDYIYRGDYSKWIKFANSLKLRLAMRIVYADPVKAKRYAEEAVNNPYGVLTSNTDNALLGASDINNPLTEIWDSYTDTRMGAHMESFLVGYNDPRVSAYFNVSTRGDGKYHGIRNGITISNKTTYVTFSTPKIAAKTPVQWMVAAEMYFLRAEGAIRGWSMGGTAESLYNKGIETSFQKENLGGSVATYIANATDKPTNYVDPASSSNNFTATTAITVKWDETASLETKLERVITQKWLAIFPDGQEAWSEFRRTGYPKLAPVRINRSPGGNINTTVQIRRLTFSYKEYANNNAEVIKAIGLLGDGAQDTGGTKLWWDKK